MEKESKDDKENKVEEILSVSMHLPPPSPMDLRGDVVDNWNFFQLQFSNYSIATGLSSKTDQVKVATLLSVIGKECLKIFINLDLTEEEKSDVDSILKAFEKYFQPDKNVIYERFVFGSANQNPNESIEQYICRLRQLASTCDYKALESELIRDRLVLGVADMNLRKKLLADSKLTLSTAIDTSRAHEATDNQFRLIHKEPGHSNEVHKVRARQHNLQGRTASHSHNSSTSKNRPSYRKADCIFCGKSHEFKRDLCPAFGKRCDKCSKMNHFAKVCKNKSVSFNNKQKFNTNKFSRNFQRSVNAVSCNEQNDESSSESLYKIDSINRTNTIDSKPNGNKRQWYTKVTFTMGNLSSQCKLMCQLDTGASCNIIHKNDFDKLCTDASKLKDSSTILKCYSGNTITPLGETELICLRDHKSHRLLFQVVDEPIYQKPLLSAETCEQLGILQVNAKLYKIEETEKNWSKSDIIKEFKDVFTGLGSLPGVFHLEVDSAVTPVKSSPRRIAIPLRDKLKEKLQELEELGVIVKEKEPTNWISNIVIVMRNDKMRLCLDPKQLNDALLRPHYQLPTIDDVLPDLARARVFTVLDAKNGFWQINLDEESSKLTTFWTPQGRYRWKRLAFGLKPAPEEFQRRLHEIFYEIKGVAVIADDILVYGIGETDEEAIIDHDDKLRKVFIRAREVNLKLNEKKMRLREAQVSYMGHVLSKNGLKADDLKVKAVVNMKAPENIKELQRFLGFVNYLAKFVPRLADVCEPLRQLTRKEVPWTWDESHEQAFREVKSKISSTPVLQYYNVTEPVTIQCDASSIGLGATVLQKGLPIAYASRTLSEVERRYAQIEKECLAILFACNRFQHFISGKCDVTVETDHQPLVSIFKKSLLVAPRRLQSMLLRLQKYTFTLKYKKGTDMVLADTLSRSLNEDTKKTNAINENDLETFQIFTVKNEQKIFKCLEKIDPKQNLNVTETRLQQIKEATSQDEILQKLSETVLVRWPQSKKNLSDSLKEYWNYRDEITVYDGIVFRGSRLIVPTTMRKEMLARIHSNHQGIDACLRKARDILFWPRMSSDIKQIVENCATCLLHSSRQAHMPMQTHEIPTLPWTRVAMDIFTYHGKNYLITTDYFSDFFELDELPDMTSRTVIDITKKNFSRWGIPITLVTDNALTFTAKEWVDFTREWEFDHVTSSPYHPHGNGKAEATVKIAKNCLKKNSSEGDIWLALLEIRNTPTTDMDSSPAQRLMSRRTRSLLPATYETMVPEVSLNVTKRLEDKKKKYKFYYDRTSKNLSQLEIGQGVAVCTPPLNKTNKWELGTVASRLSSRSYQVKTSSGSYRRNREWLKPTKVSPKRNTFRYDIPFRQERHKTVSLMEKPTRPDSSMSDYEHEQETQEELPRLRTTRSGRTIKTPERYKN